MKILFGSEMGGFVDMRAGAVDGAIDAAVALVGVVETGIYVPQFGGVEHAGLGVDFLGELHDAVTVASCQDQPDALTAQDVGHRLANNARSPQYNDDTSSILIHAAFS